ncbi:MAG TPA: hypothetical protein VG317_20275 [Pseudonocardiaceae bacterium]|nr:hypothetical protein [Pseudonocardiaceae bacterium]
MNDMADMADDRTDAAAHSPGPSRIEAERAAIRESSGAFTECYPAGYLQELHQEWPE